MKKKVVFWAVSLALVLISPRASGLVAAEAVSPKANSHPLYTQLRALDLSGDSVAVSSLTLERDIGRFQFRNGRFHFLAPVEGRVTGAVFIGEGVFQISPTMDSEKRHLEILTGESALAEDFNKLVLRFTDSTYQEIVEHASVEKGTAGDRAKEALRDQRKLFKKGRRFGYPNVAAGYVPYNLDARVLVDLARTGGKTLFLAHFEGKQSGDFLFLIDPLGLPFVAPEEVALVNLSEKRLGIWVAAHMLDHYQRAFVDEASNLIDIEHQNIDATVEKEDLKASVQTRFKSRVDGLGAVPFDLHPSLRVSKVTDSQGRELHFIQEDRKEDADLTVVLADKVERGESATLTFEYEGDKALHDAGGGNYTLLARTNWYPATSFGDRALFDIKLRAPKRLEVVATGRKINEREDGKYTVTSWKSEIPLAVAGFNYGQFKKAVTEDKEIDYTIETYANRYIPDYLRQLQYSAIGALNTVSMMDRARSEAQTAMRLYTNKFGRLPYGRLAMTQQPAPGFGQAWPMLVYMPLSAFLDSTFRFQVFRVIGGSFFKYVAAHEVAHQWWGHILGWKSYRDQWMSEGFSEFSASLFAQVVYGNDKFREFWKEKRESILQTNVKGVRPADVGVLTMGYRSDTPKTGDITRNLIYPKGAFVLHMLRMMMWDPQGGGDARFDAMMNDFVESHKNQNVSTDDFQRVVERHMTPQMNLESNGKMDWFFRQWVHGTEIPRYRLDYRLEDAPGGQVKLIGKVTQSEVSDRFAMLVPIYLDVGRDEPLRLGASTIFGNSETPEFEVLLPQRPKDVMICWYEDVLARIDGR